MPRKKTKVTKPEYCFFCTQGKEPDFMDLATLEMFLTPRGKMMPHQETGLCAKHQRRVAGAIKLARELALV